MGVRYLCLILHLCNGVHVENMETICDTGRQSTIKTHLRPVRYWISSTGTYNQHTVKLSAVLLLLSVSLLNYLVSPSDRLPPSLPLSLPSWSLHVCPGAQPSYSRRLSSLLWSQRATSKQDSFQLSHASFQTRASQKSLRVERKRVRRRPRCSPPAFIICMKKKTKTDCQIWAWRVNSLPQYILVN